ncbi:MAG: hypothetical protein ACJAZX_000690 [Rickettsiales bacterium]|jgi:hypothetical protein
MGKLVESTSSEGKAITPSTKTERRVTFSEGPHPERKTKIEQESPHGTRKRSNSIDYNSQEMKELREFLDELKDNEEFANKVSVETQEVGGQKL